MLFLVAIDWLILLIDGCFHCSLVAANVIWAIGDVFYPLVDGEPHSMWERFVSCHSSIFRTSCHLNRVTCSNKHNRTLYRWWCCWILFAAYVPIVLLYLVWVPVTLLKLFPSRAQHSCIELVVASAPQSEKLDDSEPSPSQYNEINNQNDDKIPAEMEIKL